MTTQDLQNKINTLKEAWTNFGNTDFKMTGISIIRQNSSDNWLFNTNVDINEVVPVVLKALEQEIATLEATMPELQAAEQAEIDAAEAQRILEESQRVAQQAARDEELRLQKLNALKEEAKLRIQAEEMARKELGL